ncbi:MAG: chitobiase/beta-hexosaminidase C-terminal domain-containing protein [Prevotella sp.]|nr:chitobiase/beta-hexosaminidase C-terminal domain-containing protein [Prevotella sp.]
MVSFAEDQTWSFGWGQNKSSGGEGFYPATSNTETTLTATINGWEWTILSDSPKYSYSKALGQMVGTAATPASHVSFSTESAPQKIKSVSVKARLKDNTYSGTLKVEVGGVGYQIDGSDSQALNGDSTVLYTFIPDGSAQEGKVDIIIDQTSETKAAMYLRYVSVVYGEIDEPQYEEANWSYEWNKTKQNGGEGFYNFGSTWTDEVPLVTTINGLVWYAQAEGTKTFAMTASGGQTIGSDSSNAASHVEFWTEDIDGKVTDITVNSRLNNANYTGYVKVSVNGVSYLYNGSEAADMSNIATDYKFVAPNGAEVNGKILIELFQTSETKGTLYLKRLDINYLKEGVPPGVTVPKDPVFTRSGAYQNEYMFKDEEVTISSETEGATIYYTLNSVDEKNPKDPKMSEERVEYIAPVLVTKSVLISAVAVKDGVYSNVVNQKYYMYKNPELFFEGYQDEATVEVGFVGVPVPVNNPHNVGPLNWNSENEDIATVDEDGTIHALAEGTVNINFYFDGNDEYSEMGGRLKLTVEKAKEYETGMYVFNWNKSRNDGGEGFYQMGSTASDNPTVTASLNGVNWTITSVGTTTYAFTGTMGQSIGKPSEPASHVELYTTGIAGEITEVKVKARKQHDDTEAQMKVSVNDIAYSADGADFVSLTNDSVEYVFVPNDSPQEGKILITIDQTSEAKSTMYLKQIIVNYRSEVTNISAPTASIEAGIYDEAQSVELFAEELISSSKPATIYYTVDGSNPKASETAKEYTEAISISETTTLKAITKFGDKYSPVAEFKYIIRKDAELSFEKEEISLDYSDDYYIGVYLNNPHNLSPIRYESSDEDVVKLDGYADIWTIAPGEATITAYFDGNDEYKPATASYKVTVKALEPLITPTVSPAGGSFAEPVDVTITAGSDWGIRAVTIWYSTNATSVEEMEDDWEKRTVWPESPGFDYSTNSITIKIEKSCKLIVMAKGYNSLSSEAVEVDFVIDPTLKVDGINVDEAIKQRKVYNLQGQRVEKNSKGVYIIDGRKIVIK